MRRLTLCIFLLLLAPAVVHAQEPAGARLDVVDVSGPLDGPAFSFIRESISTAAGRGSQAVVIQLDSPGVVAEIEDFQDLVSVVEEPPLPVAVWIGSQPAVAYGGALELLAAFEFWSGPQFDEASQKADESQAATSSTAHHGRGRGLDLSGHSGAGGNRLVDTCVSPMWLSP